MATNTVTSQQEHSRDGRSELTIPSQRSEDPMRAEEETLVRVHREWRDWQSAEVRLTDLHDIHWLQPRGRTSPAGVRARMVYELHQWQHSTRLWFQPPSASPARVCAQESRCPPGIFDDQQTRRRNTTGIIDLAHAAISRRRRVERLRIAGRTFPEADVRQSRQGWKSTLTS
jgi:hypothetical protein